MLCLFNVDHDSKYRSLFKLSISSAFLVQHVNINKQYLSAVDYGSNMASLFNGVTGSEEAVSSARPEG